MTGQAATEIVEALKRTKTERPKLLALVVATWEREGELTATIVHCSWVLHEDIRESVDSFDAGDSLGNPPKAGIWVWEGDIVSRRCHEGDYDVDYVGTYRPATSAEVDVLINGEGLWSVGDEEWRWPESEPERDPEL